MVEIKIINPNDFDKTITVIRDPVKYTIPANGEVIIILEDPNRDSIILE